MTYRTTRCPHCGHRIEIMVSSNLKHYGSPLRCCPKCNEMYIDKNYIEIALQGVRTIDKMLFSPGWIITLIISIGLIILGCMDITSDDNSMSWLFIILGGILAIGSIWAVIDEIRSHKNNMRKLEDERIASETRMTNKEYVELLKQAGIIKK